ncbi:hypothetical protein D3C75_555530 [compost metagenome]
MLLRGPGSALHDQAGVAADGGGQILREPGLGCSRLADQEQRPVGHQSGNGHFHQPVIAHILGGDDFLTGFAAGDKGQNGAGRHAPPCGGLAVVRFPQLLQLLRIQNFRRLPQKPGGFRFR